ncbi:MAG TPA: NfeD family protein [Acidimicrobiia bacterium]|nr:NfeD family protein [Acidimicrobiia bacterium]
MPLLRADSSVPALTTRLLAGALLALAALGMVASGAAAQSDDEAGGIDVVQVEGLLDRHNAALIESAVGRSEERGATVLIFQLDSGGALDVDLERLLGVIEAAEVPIAFWVGPSGAEARGGAALLALSGASLTVSPGSGIGPLAPLRLDDPSAVTDDEIARRATELQGATGRALGDLVDTRLSAREAQRAEVSDVVCTRVDAQLCPTIGEFIVSLDGRTVTTAGGTVRLSTAEVIGEGLDRRRQPNQEVRFGKLDLVAQAGHTLGAPWVAYVLFVVGAALLVLEFYTASIGIGGAVGAVSVVAACYGFSHLPVQGWAVALLAIGVVGLAIDLQAGGLGAWTFLGGSALVAGSITLYGGSSRLDPAWWIVVFTCGGTIVFMLSGMTAMVRSRFSTPTIGREDLIGELGDAEVAIAPNGVVRVRDALWRASTNRATPIAAGDRIRVVAVTGVMLEVEPEAGGARDYRERARDRSPRPD